MYTVAAVIQMLGLSAVSMVSPLASLLPHFARDLFRVFYLTPSSQRRARLVKLYAYGSILSALLILAGNLTRIVIHFSQKVGDESLTLVASG